MEKDITINVVLEDINYIPGYKAAEEKRRANEQKRISDEEQRISNEQERIANEEERIKNENERETYYKDVISKNLLEYENDLNDLFENASQSLKKIKCFDSVEEMKVDDTLVDGYVTKTLGYYEKNDGGSGLYKIRNKKETDVEDGGLIHFLVNNLVAEMIIEDSINVKQFGAKGNGVNDDTSFIQLALNTHSNIFIPQGNYLITNVIKIPQKTNTYGIKGKSKFISRTNEKDVFHLSYATNIYDLVIEKTNSSNCSVFEISEETLKGWKLERDVNCKINIHDIDVITDLQESENELAIFDVHLEDNILDSNENILDGFYNLKIKNVVHEGKATYLFKSYTYNNNWITSTYIDNVSSNGSEWFIFDGKTASNLLDVNVKNVATPLIVTNSQHQANNKSKAFCFHRFGNKSFDNCIAWDRHLTSLGYGIFHITKDYYDSNNTNIYLSGYSQAAGLFDGQITVEGFPELKSSYSNFNKIKSLIDCRLPEENDFSVKAKSLKLDTKLKYVKIFESDISKVSLPLAIKFKIDVQDLLSAEYKIWTSDISNIKVITEKNGDLDYQIEFYYKYVDNILTIYAYFPYEPNAYNVSFERYALSSNSNTGFDGVSMFKTINFDILKNYNEVPEGITKINYSNSNLYVPKSTGIPGGYGALSLDGNSNLNVTISSSIKYLIPYMKIGYTNDRPLDTALGFLFYDLSINKMIISKGNNTWLDLMGNAV